MKILILKPSSLGDVVQALPVARLLRGQLPGARIHWWLNRDLLPLLDGDPDIERIIPFDRKLWSGPTGFPSLLSTVRSLRAEHYDWVIDLQSLARSAILGWITRGARTIGLDDPREGAPAFYDLAVPRRSPTTHAVDWYLDVLRALGIEVDRRYEWMPPRTAVEARLKRHWFSGQSKWIAIQPGARWLNKRWPASSFSELCSRLLDGHPDRRIAVLGGRGDHSLGEAILSGTNDPRVVNLCGELSLPEMVEFLRQCSLMISNDTGPMHVAVAVNTPVIGLFGPTTPERTGPYGELRHVKRVELPCAPCMKSRCRNPIQLECLQLIQARDVASAAEERLAHSRSVR